MDTITCTGCGCTGVLSALGVAPEGWWYGDHADTYSGTVWHCPKCAAVCQDEPRLCCEHCGRPLTDREAEQAEDVDGEMWCCPCAVLDSGARGRDKQTVDLTVACDGE